jgi:dsRNA-specific ribonuclease
MLFHELCVKHKKGQPTWDFESTGPTNSRTWKASATVDGHRVGTGQGATKQIAKEDAAKQALQTLGWG